MIGSLGHIFHFLFNVQGLIEWGGVLLVCVIVFIETGFFVGFFLPGDSLLVTAGVFAAAGLLRLSTLLVLVSLCAIAGDQVGYWIGRKAGQALYRREDSVLFRRRHLERARRFYDTYGGKTVILARFVPIVRTFCPPVAGAAGMKYTRYLAYGFFLGSVVPNINTHIHWVIAVVVLLSLLPAIIGALRARHQKPDRPAPSLPDVQPGQD